MEKEIRTAAGVRYYHAPKTIYYNVKDLAKKLNSTTEPPHKEYIHRFEMFCYLTDCWATASGDKTKEEMEAFANNLDAIVTENDKHLVTLNAELRNNNERRTTYVYILLFENGVVKIGVTKNMKSRMSSLNSAACICDGYHTAKRLGRKIALLIEKALHKRFADRRKFSKGSHEYFINLSLDEACAALREYSELTRLEMTT